MKEEQDYIRDIAEIRSMMERSSKFLSLSGWAGILAGIYALSGVYIAYRFFDFNPSEIASTDQSAISSSSLLYVIILALIVFLLAAGTSVFLTYKKAGKRGEKLWNPTSRRLLISMTIPLVIGGLLELILISKELIGLLAPFTLLFYGLALYNAGNFTYKEVKILGLVQMGLGLAGTYFIEYGLAFWALGFGMVHIVYGIYIYYRFEK
jgi:uncharacterized membrane protein YidH (DUF202 family)